MPSLRLHHHPCKSSLPLCFTLPHNTSQSRTISTFSTPLSTKFQNLYSLSLIASPNKSTTIYCSPNEEISNTQVEEETEELELLGKPSPLPQSSNGSASELVEEPPKPEKDEILAPFLKFFSSKDTVEDVRDDSEVEFVEEVNEGGERSSEVAVEYYEPKPGDFVVGVVVSGNDNKIDVNIGADLLGTMLTKEVLPLYEKEFPYLLCDLEKDAEEFMVQGKMGIVFDEDAVSGEPVSGRPVVETGTILFAEVLGRTLSGRPLLSTRRLFKRVAWHRVRQIKELNNPIEVRITEWNTGGLLTRIEGLRAFIPKAELMNRVNNFTDLKQNVGRRIFVRICRIDEEKNDLILSEREAWDMMYLQEGTLLEGTVKKIFPYGAQVRIGDTNRSGLLHISNITRSRVNSVSDLLSVDEKVKVLVVKSMFPDKISLSIVDLESEPGLFVSDKEKVFSEAEEMAKKYRQKLPVSLTHESIPAPTDVLPFDDEEKLYANWKWFKFLNENGRDDKLCAMWHGRFKRLQTLCDMAWSGWMTYIQSLSTVPMGFEFKSSGRARQNGRALLTKPSLTKPSLVLADRCW